MKTREFPLSHHWTLVAHETFSVYVSVDNPNKFSINDWDDDATLTLSTEENTFEVHKARYDTAFKVNLSNRTITVLLKPDEDFVH